jgi:ATP-dependent DNA helicase DinG
VLSATLQDLNGFARFQGKSGFPEGARTIALDYTFPYHLSTLTVAGMRYTPKQGEREEFVEELKDRLLKDINPEEATLFPFPSRKMMNEVVPVLKAYFGEDMVLVQGEMPIKALVDEHLARIDAGLGSILCGMQTMAEGLDLPGKYCEHVGIITLPFAVPTDAVEQEIQERMGSRYFMERSLPDALIRLIQAVGRLLRTEDDRGRVTVYDRRLASTFYGQKMLKRLPPYKVIIEPVAPKK